MSAAKPIPPPTPESDALILRHRHLVTKTRQRIVPTVPTKIAAEDLEQEGTFALIRAARQFDPGRGVQFPSYAITMVRGALLEWLRKEDWVPRSVRTQQKAVKEARQACALELGRDPTEAELADFLGLDIDAVAELSAAAQTLQQVSIEDVVGDGEHDDLDPLPRADSLADPAHGPDEETERRLQAEEVRRALSWLPTPERKVFDLYYGQGWTLKQAAEEMGKSESRVHQLHLQGLARLREFLQVPDGPTNCTSRRREVKTDAPPLTGHPLTRKAIAAVGNYLDAGERIWPWRPIADPEREAVRTFASNIGFARARGFLADYATLDKAATCLLADVAPGPGVTARMIALAVPKLSGPGCGALAAAIQRLLPPEEKPAPEPAEVRPPPLARLKEALARRGVDLTARLITVDPYDLAQEAGISRGEGLTLFNQLRREATSTNQEEVPMSAATLEPAAIAPEPTGTERTRSGPKPAVRRAVLAALDARKLTLADHISCRVAEEIGRELGKSPGAVTACVSNLRRARGVQVAERRAKPAAEAPALPPAEEEQQNRGGRAPVVQPQVEAALAARGIDLTQPVSGEVCREIGEGLGKTGGAVCAAIAVLRRKKGIPAPLTEARRRALAEGAQRRSEERAAREARLLAALSARGIPLEQAIPSEVRIALAQEAGFNPDTLDDYLSRLRRERGIKISKEAAGAAVSSSHRRRRESAPPAAAQEPAAGLRIAEDLALPLEAVTETFAILGKRGSGKSSTASVLCEELHRAGRRFVVIDPLGVWWGIRSSADGSAPRLAVPILGGPHGDLPLDPEDGEALAAALVETGASCIIDLSDWRKERQQRFVAAFAEELYRTNREPLMLVLDEADLFAAQAAGAGSTCGGACRSAVDDLVRRGRTRGLGVTLLSQRAAVISKSVLSQCETLLALRTAGPNDRAAIDAWVDAHGDEEQRRALAASLPSLAVGEAWIASAGWLNLFRRVRIRRRSTWDSSATPKAGQVVVGPSVLAEVGADLLSQLRERLAPAPVEGPAPGRLLGMLTRREQDGLRELVAEALERGGGILYGDEREAIMARAGVTEHAVTALAARIRDEQRAGMNGNGHHPQENLPVPAEERRPVAVAYVTETIDLPPLAEEDAAASLLFAATGQAPADFGSWPLARRLAFLARSGAVVQAARTAG